MSSIDVVFISHFIPTVENIGGPSSLPYYLLKYREPSIQVHVYSYNFNKISRSKIHEIEQNLNLSISLLETPIWFRLLKRLDLIHYFNIICKYPINSYITLKQKDVKGIEELNPSLIWIYPHLYFRIAKQFSKYNKVVSGPDSSALYSYRTLEDSYSLDKKKRTFRQILEYLRNIRLEQKWNIPNTKIHLVGKSDLAFFEKISLKKDSFFLLHPHFGLENKIIKFSSPRLKILISGKFDVYTYTDTQAFFEELLKSEDLTDKLEFTFIGKGWETLIEKLKKKRYICSQVQWVENYLNEIIKYDIQIFLISVGTGTKGKVLDALSSGLLCIGSEYAFENISIRKNESCLLYKSVEDIPLFIHSILDNRSRYEKIAERGRYQVRKYHNPERISKRFWNISIK